MDEPYLLAAAAGTRPETKTTPAPNDKRKAIIR